MKRIYETFTEEEFKKLSRVKKKVGLNWHEFIMTLAENKEQEK